MGNRIYIAWIVAGFDIWQLGAEAGEVATMRLARIAAGGAGADAEARLMISEKVSAFLEMQTKMLSGAFGTTPLSGTQSVIKHYRRKVAANTKRLRGTVSPDGPLCNPRTGR